MEKTLEKFVQLAAADTIGQTSENLRRRGIAAELLPDRQAVLTRLQELIPQGASVMTAASKTLDEIGFTNLLISGDHPWNNLKAGLFAEKDPERKARLRKESSLADYYLGSVHALSRDGELVFASASGSQLPAYCFDSRNIIWIVGTQKIMPTLGQALERVMQYCWPEEDRHQKEMGNAAGSYIGKLLIFQREMPELKRSLRLLFVNERLGV